MNPQGKHRSSSRRATAGQALGLALTLALPLVLPLVVALVAAGCEADDPSLAADAAPDGWTFADAAAVAADPFADAPPATADAPAAPAAAREKRSQAARRLPALADVALPSPVRLTRAIGPVGARLAGEAQPRPLLSGTELARAAELSTGRGGAVLELGPAAAPGGRLWLGAWTTVRLDAAAGGALRVTLRQGDARLRAAADGPPVLLDGAPRAADRARTAGVRDVVLQRPHPEAELAHADTARHPEWAAWTVDLEREAPATDTAAAGFGTLEAAAGPEGAAGRLSLRLLAVRARRAGDLVATEVEHVFHNGSDRQLEGTFRFPLPDGAAVTGLAMEVDGRLMEGELVEREKARQTYESIVRQMQDPALLEWEQGQTFRLRVFPIEPRADKRVVLRYLAPLARGPQGRTFVYPLAAPELQERIGRVRVELDGAVALDAEDVLPAQARDVVLPLGPEREPAPVGRETRPDGTYTAVRLRPDVARLAGGRAAPEGPERPATLVVALDTSRSALESWPLALESLAALLGALAPADRFGLVACDVVCHWGDEVGPATPERVAAALAFAAGIEPDGASDLELLLRSAGSQAHESGATQIVYVGDGVATWGRTAPAELALTAAAAVGGVPFAAVVLGRGADLPFLEDLAGRLGGRVLRPSDAADVARFAFVLRAGGAAARLRAVRVASDADGAAGDELWPDGATTLFEGDELLVLLRTPAGAPAPAALRLSAEDAEGRPVQWAEPLPAAAPEDFVAHRWAARRIARLDSERSQAPADRADALRQEVVRLSRDFGVLSRHTALLVLESEEAYRQHDIERRRGAGGESDPAAPPVTGADLGSPDDREASLTPDEIQPGDPEVFVPAPADARSVVVVFPFGETKVARWEPALQLWTVRFLIAADTPEGVYEVWVRVTHADGRIELQRLTYTVDTSRPEVTVALHPLPGRRPRYEVVARPTVLGAASGAGTGAAADAGAGTKDRRTRIVSDVARVEVGLPDGAVLRLRRAADGTFRRTWRPRTPVEGPVTLRVVAVDRALNAQAQELTLDPHAAATGE